MSLYECSSCTEPIRPDRARIQCQTCTDYNLCTNCFAIQKTSRTHLLSHPTAIIKTSGTSTPTVPPPVPPRPLPLLPPRKDTLTNITAPNPPPKKVELPTANWGALWDIVKPSKKPKNSSGGPRDLLIIQPPPNDDGFINHNLTYSDSPLTKLRPELPAQSFEGSFEGKIKLEAFTNPYASLAPPMPSEWSPFFQKDGAFNAIFVDLMTTMFLCLDVEGTNELSPEVWSAFLEMQGVGMENNIWQKTLYTTGGPQNQEIADLELGIFFKTHDISHTLSVRHASNLPPPSPSPTAGERIRRSISLGANMPMLSRQGFIDVMGMEMLQDPDEGHRRLEGVVRDYAIWKPLGDVPRECFLDGKIEGRGKRRSLLEMSEEKEEVERKIMEGMFRGVGAGKIGGRNRSEDSEERRDRSRSRSRSSSGDSRKTDPAVPERFAFDTTDEEERTGDRKSPFSHIEVDVIPEDEFEDTYDEINRILTREDIGPTDIIGAAK
ncbi:hypothetical protein ACHAQE_005936 [Botrytis cinerea]